MRRSVWKKAVWVGAVLGVIGAGVHAIRAEVTLEIFRTEAERILLALMPLQLEGAAQEDSVLMMEVLLRDLHRSQVFRPIELMDSEWSFKDAPNQEQARGLVRLGYQAAVWGKLVKTAKDYRFDGHVYDVPSGSPVLERRYVGQLSPRERQLRLIGHRFADEVVFRFTGERGIAQTRIAYASDESGHKEIYVMDYDGYDPRRITGDRSIALTPRWSPDGRFLAYVSYHEGDPAIYIHELITARRVRIVDMSGLNISPAWSHDGKFLAFANTREGNAEIYVMELPVPFNAPRTSKNRAKRLTFSLGDDISPSWSPTGDQMAFVSDRGGSPQIYVMNSDGSHVRRLTFEGSYNTSPAWSPKGDWIAFTCRRDEFLKLCMVSPDGQRFLQITDGPWDDEAPSWSPNGRHLVFSSRRGKKNHLFFVTAGGRDEEQLTFTSGNENVPGWSWN